MVLLAEKQVLLKDIPIQMQTKIPELHGMKQF